MVELPEKTASLIRLGKKKNEEESSDDHGTKRLKHAPTVEDRISALPDSILLTILSSLPTEDAIKTGVLSKRWAYLWTSVPSLSFTDTSFETAADFATAVDHALLLHRAPKLTDFSVLFYYEPELKLQVDLWVRFATTAKVDQLSLLLLPFSTRYKRYKLPQYLYTNEFVSELHFLSCKIKPNGLIGWSSLKHLYFGNTSLADDVINKVLLGSPKLESLELHNCFHFERLDIMSESLKKLVIDTYCVEGGWQWDEELELQIVAPKIIESLEIIGNFFDVKKCQIKDVSALVEVKLDFEMPIVFASEDEVEAEDLFKNCENVVRELFESLHQVKKLVVGKWCLMVLSIMSVKYRPSPLLKCKCLTIKTSMERWDLPGIAYLLQSSPYVETLVIDIISSCSIGSELKYLVSSYDAVSHWKSKEINFKFLLLCLKSIKIFSFGETSHTKEFILVVQFLLKNAKVLEKMVITEPRAMQTPTRNMLRKSLRVAQKLLGFPRSSPHAMVMFLSQ